MAINLIENLIYLTNWPWFMKRASLSSIQDRRIVILFECSTSWCTRIKYLLILFSYANVLSSVACVENLVGILFTYSFLSSHNWLFPVHSCNPFMFCQHNPQWTKFVIRYCKTCRWHRSGIYYFTYQRMQQNSCLATQAAALPIQPLPFPTHETLFTQRKVTIGWRITVRPVSCLTWLDLTKEENMFLIVCSKAVESTQVKL